MASPGFSPVPSTPPSQAVIEQKLRAEQLVKSGAGWFLAIAGLSIVNSALTLSGAHFSFIFGLGVTQVVDAVGQQGGSTGSTLGLVVNAFIAGIFVLFWNFARKGEKWAFIVGMGLYLMDGLILIPFKDYLSVAFHAYALFRIYGGMQGIPELQRLQQVLAPAGVPIEPQ